MCLHPNEVANWSETEDVRVQMMCCAASGGESRSLLCQSDSDEKRIVTALSRQVCLGELQ
jgi:hypothetical protein